MNWLEQHPSNHSINLEILLQKSTPSRIVVVSSIAHERGKINCNDLNSDNSYDEGSAYNQSKLANILFANELSRKLTGTGVTVNSVHPGIVDTDLMRHMSIYSSWIAKYDSQKNVTNRIWCQSKLMPIDLFKEFSSDHLCGRSWRMHGLERRPLLHWRWTLNCRRRVENIFGKKFCFMRLTWVPRRLSSSKYWSVGKSEAESVLIRTGKG